MKPTIKVRYSCFLCQLTDIEVEMPAREEEDILVWMSTMGAFISRDHALKSPYCHPEELKNVKVPIGFGDKIGGAIAQ